jgi:uncharacterized protein
MQIVIVAATIPQKMKQSLIPKKAPNLLSRKIDDGAYFVVNCSHPNSLRLLNQAQWDVLSAVNGMASVAELSKELRIEEQAASQLLDLLRKTEIILFDDNFNTPQRPKSPGSLNFWIHTTNRCNLACTYCYISTLHQSGGMLDATKARLLAKVEQTVKDRGIRHIKFRLAGGEPLTQFKSWKAFITEARRSLAALGCVFEASFISNLTILTDEIIDFAREYGVSFGVSLDGVAKYNDVTRPNTSGGGSFEKIDRNLRKLVAAGIPVSVNTVVTNQNLEGLPELTQFLIGLDVPFRYSIVKGEPIDALLLERYLTETYQIMETAVARGWQFSNRHQFCDLKPNELGFQTCASGFSGGAIYVDGTLNYCHVHFGDASEPSYSIFDEDLDLVDMIEQGSHYEDMKSADCLKCRYKSVCTSGCPVYRVDGKDPQCSIYHKFIPMIYELQARERLKLLQDYRMME